MSGNIDHAVVDGFGDEWSRFDQSQAPEPELRQQFEAYFATFPWHLLPASAVGFDLGCGSGRWAQFVAPRVGKLHLVDPAKDALAVARRNLRGQTNCEFHLASLDDIPLADDSMDFGYSLGVLHHVPDTFAGIRACVAKLKPGAPFLVYLYYAFDNRPAWFRRLWQASDLLRRLVSRAPRQLRMAAADALALFIYLPLARGARACEQLGVGVDRFPLSFYRRKSFYTMRTDALDRFGTRLEQRFTRDAIERMMRDAGLTDIRFGGLPYWCATGVRR